MTKIFIFFAQNLKNANIRLCLHLIKSKLQYSQIHVQLKTLVYIQMQNSINFGTEFSFQNIMIQHFNYLEKLLGVLSFLPILQTTLMHIFLKQIHIIPFVMDYMTNSNLTPLFTPSWFADAFITLFV